MPEEFAHLQGLNAANIGFLQDLVHGVEKLVKSGGSVPAAAAVPSTATAESLLQRAELFLEAGQFDNAAQYCERVLDMAPKDYRPYLYQSLCHFKLRNTRELASSAKLVHMDTNFQNALRFATPAKQAELTQIAASAYANAERQYAQVRQDMEQDINAQQQDINGMKAQCDPIIQVFQNTKKMAQDSDAEIKNQEKKRVETIGELTRCEDLCKQLRDKNTFTMKGGAKGNRLDMDSGMMLLGGVQFLGIFLVVALIGFWLNTMLGVIVICVAVGFFALALWPNKTLNEDKKQYQEARNKIETLNRRLSRIKQEYDNLLAAKRQKESEANQLYAQNKAILDRYQNVRKKQADVQKRLAELNQRHEASAAKARELRII